MGRYEPYSSLSGYYDDYVVNITIIALILIGGLGFTVWADIKHNKLHFKKYTLHTKIVVVSSIILVVIPTSCSWCLKEMELKQVCLLRTDL